MSLERVRHYHTRLEAAHCVRYRDTMAGRARRLPGKAEWKHRIGPELKILTIGELDEDQPNRNTSWGGPGCCVHDICASPTAVDNRYNLGIGGERDADP